LESQRVKSITEGYLRGWLKFDYPLDSSYLREELVLCHIYDQHTYELLKNRLFIETTLRSAIRNKSKDALEPIFELARSLIELKLPSILSKDTIKKDTADLPDANDLKEWKEFLDRVNKK